MTVVVDIMTNIIMFIQTLNHFDPKGKYTLWENRTFAFPDNENVEGFLTINNAEISVVMEEYDPFNITNVVEENNNYRACLYNLTFSEFNLTFEYDADIGINNEFPLYGNGFYNGTLSNVSTTFCWLLEQNLNEILEFNIDVVFKHKPVSVTGLYRNEEFSLIISDLLTEMKRRFAMWNNYELDCSKKCILNPLFLFMTNYLIYNIDRAFGINWDECKCLWEGLDNFMRHFDLLTNGYAVSLMDMNKDLNKKKLTQKIFQVLEDILTTAYFD